MAIAALVVAAPPAAVAMWSLPQQIPLERLVANLTAYTEEHPQDSTGFYALGRVHSAAFATGYTTFRAYETDGQVQPRGVPNDPSSPIPGARMGFMEATEHRLDRDERREHLAAAVACIETALALDPKGEESGGASARLHLSLAYVLDRGAEFATEVDILPGIDLSQPVDERRLAQFDDAMNTLDWNDHRLDDMRLLFEQRNRGRDAQKRFVQARLEAHWKTQAATHYLAAFRLAMDDDLANAHPPAGNRGGYRQIISHEAGASYLRVIVARGPLPEDRDAITEVNEGLKRLELHDWGGGWITPIVFSIDAPAPLAALLSPTTTVEFDLDGSGRRSQRWPWVLPTTAILCWDPDHTGVITSGRQLFGSATWWLLLPDGYRALDALDDNRDGELAGAELAGLALWFDRNSNGVSDPGEVIPIEGSDVAGVATRAVTEEDGSLASPNGLRLRDGRTLPTYDWIVEECRP